MRKNSVAVVIPIFGEDPYWDRIALRALASVAKQTRAPEEVFMIRSTSLASARNAGLMITSSEWVCFLDADDELEPGYLEAMLDHALTGDLRYPRVRHIDKEGRVCDPFFPKVWDLQKENHMVCATLVRARAVIAFGGFREWPAYEDWDLWLRMIHAGAHAQFVPDAVYLYHREEGTMLNQVANPKLLMQRIIRSHEDGECLPHSFH